MQALLISGHKQHPAQSEPVELDTGHAEGERAEANMETPDEAGVNSQPAGAPPNQPAPAVTGTESNSREAVERDTILLLGRQGAGKTVYLATLYAKLYEGHNGLVMKALRGPDHVELMTSREKLRHGEWPAGTLKTTEMPFELLHEGGKRLMVSLDYSGEDFQRAFMHENTDNKDVKLLLNYVDRAAAVVLLLDPGVVLRSGHKQDDPWGHKARADDEFGMDKAVERIRGWRGGDKVPIILAFTKADRHSAEIKAAGGVRSFAIKHYPALMRSLGDVPIVPVSAVQQTSRNGETRPHPRSKPSHIETPILLCLQRLRRSENQAADERVRTQIEQQIADEEASALRAERRRHFRFWFWFWVLVVLAVAAAIAVPLLIHKYGGGG